MTGSTVMPCLRYRDAKRMISWLCDAFGFRPQAVYEDGSEGVAHAQLTLGNGMIMLGFAARRSVQPSAIHPGRSWRDHAESVPGRCRRRCDL
jgi:uncharacterized glyoxalase superfamily protein PhnB